MEGMKRVVSMGMGLRRESSGKFNIANPLSQQRGGQGKSKGKGGEREGGGEGVVAKAPQAHQHQHQEEQLALTEEEWAREQALWTPTPSATIVRALVHLRRGSVRRHRGHFPRVAAPQVSLCA